MTTPAEVKAPKPGAPVKVRTQKTERRSNFAAIGQGARKVAAGPRPTASAKGMLTAELLIGVGIVAIRAIAEYEPQADGTLKGQVGHPKGQYGPLPVLAGLIGVFFVLSFLAASASAGRQRLAVAGGGLVVLVLALKSTGDFSTVAGTFGTFGKGKTPPGDWQTSGTQAGNPIAQSAPPPDGTSPPAGKKHGKKHGKGTIKGDPGIKPGKDGKCPDGYQNIDGLCYQAGPLEG